MPLPTSVANVDIIVREEFGRLIRQTEELNERNRNDAHPFKDIALAEFTQIRTSAITLVLLLTKDSALKDKLDGEINNLPVSLDGVAQLQGILKTLQKHYKIGLLKLSTTIETSIILDYMSLAEQLLGEGVKGQYDYIPAAVLAGAVLEDALRRLCERQNPSISVKANGKHKMLRTLIDDLKQSAVFNELKAKQLEAWAIIRNVAAHGEFDKFNRSDVEQMINGIGNFLAEYL